MKTENSPPASQSPEDVEMGPPSPTVGDVPESFPENGLVPIHVIAAWTAERRREYIEQTSKEILKQYIPVIRKLNSKSQPSSPAEKNQISPPCPTALSFRNLYYKKKGRYVVNGVSGMLKYGQMVAVIGEESSYFLEVLAHRQIGGTVTGDILIGGLPADKRLARRKIAYIPKEDIHLPTMTVRETMDFSARLRNTTGSGFSESLNEFLVDIVLKTSGLLQQANTVVGDANLRGISGGEKRRLSIAVEIVAGRSIILADQPTNGLDSTNALVFGTNARTAIDDGMAAIHSLVQPSPELLSLYDSVIVLSRGAMVYSGTPKDALSYFQALGYEKPLTRSVPDFLEEVAKAPQKYIQDEKFDSKEQKITFRSLWSKSVDAYLHSEAHKDVVTELSRELRPIFEVSEEQDRDDEVEYRTTMWQQLVMTTDRQWKLMVRNKPFFFGGIFTSIFMSLLLGSIFYQLGDSQGAARSRFGLLFYSLMFSGTQAIQTVPILADFRRVFYYQSASGYFRPITYFWSLMAVQLVSVVLQTILFSMIVYPMSGLDGGFFSGKHWTFTLYLIWVSMISHSMAVFYSVAVRDVVVAQALTPITIVVWAIMNGFLVPRNSIPNIWIWIHYSSYFTYIYRALVINEMFDLTFTCAASELVPPPNPLSSLPPPFGYNGVQVCPFPDGKSFLKLYDITPSADSDKWIEFLISLVFFVFVHAMTALAIVYVRWGKGTTVVKPQEERQSFGPIQHQPSEKIRNWKPPTCYLEFSNLSYSVKVPSSEKGSRKMEDKILLSNVFGYAPPGKLIALMGASGAGKTTLLDVLAGRKTSGQISGKLTVNSQEKDRFFNRYVGYVEQMDAHVETATVREAILFSALLRLPADMPRAEKEKRVDNVIKELELTSVANERIGSVALGGLSPELRKKVTIAVELVIGPGILFLDEPTTGLPAAAAFEVMDTVRRLANNICVICTIHQPSQEVVDLFDWLLLLQKGGKVAYFGEKDYLKKYFEHVGLGICPPERNVADFALEALDNRTDQVQQGGQLPDPATLFLESSEGKKVLLKLEEGVAKDIKPPVFNSVFAASAWTQFVVLLQRFSVDTIREQLYATIRIVITIFISLVVGSLYFQLGYGQADAVSRISIMFFLILFVYFSSGASIPLVVAMRQVYFRETSSKAYSVYTYFLARVFADLPYVSLQALITSVIVYWMAGLRSDDAGIHFGQFVAMQFMVRLIGYAYSELWGDIGPNADAATGMSVVLLNIWMLFTGFLIQKAQIPVGWIWMFYVNLIRYPLFYLVGTQLEGQNFECPGGSGAVMINLGSADPICQQVPPPYDNLNCFRPACPISSGQQLIDQFGVETDQYANYFGITVAFYVAIRLLNLLALKTINHIKR